MVIQRGENSQKPMMELQTEHIGKPRIVILVVGRCYCFSKWNYIFWTTFWNWTLSLSFVLARYYVERENTRLMKSWKFLSKFLGKNMAGGFLYTSQNKMYVYIYMYVYNNFWNLSCISKCLSTYIIVHLEQWNYPTIPNVRSFFEGTVPLSHYHYSTLDVFKVCFIYFSLKLVIGKIQVAHDSRATHWLRSKGWNDR